MVNLILCLIMNSAIKVCGGVEVFLYALDRGGEDVIFIKILNLYIEINYK
jgi:hypothetical protein